MVSNLAKLDLYNTVVLPGVIRVELQGSNDPDLTDIFSEIRNSNSRIYLDGWYYYYSGEYEIFKAGGKAFLDLKVVSL